jgi:hypothetical protein
MSECLIIALVGALINMILSLVVPCIIKDSQVPILVNIKKVYTTHKQTILTSSVIVFITIYLALKLTPTLGFSMDNDMSLNPFDNRGMTKFDSSNEMLDTFLVNLGNKPDLARLARFER